jgi:hypothetical protein
MRSLKPLVIISVLLLSCPCAFTGDTANREGEVMAAKGEMEEGRPPVDPFGVRWKPPEEARVGTVYLSNDRKVHGLIYSTRGKPFRIFDDNLKKSVDVYIPEILTIETEVEEEKMEADWRWYEAASDKKVFTGKYYPRRKYLTKITLKRKDRRGKHYEFTGHLNAPVYVLENNAKEPKQFKLHIRDKGEVGTELKDLIYIKKVDFLTKGEEVGSSSAWESLEPDEMMYDTYPLYRMTVEGREAVVILPKADGIKDELPWVVYHTGAGETCEVITATEGEAKPPIVKLLLENGFLVTSITSGAQHWGDPSAEEAHEALYQYVRKTFPVQEKVNLLVQSMGGTSAYPWAISRPERVQKIYGIYPITNRPQMGVRNPIRNLAPLAKRGVKILHRHGIDDASVPFEENARQFEEAYKKVGGEIKIIGLPGLGHQFHELFFQPEEVVAFFTGEDDENEEPSKDASLKPDTPPAKEEPEGADGK